MLITVAKLSLFWGLTPGKIVHVGAHEAEELEDYSDFGWGKEGILWIEADPQLIPFLEKRLDVFPHQVAINAAVWKSEAKDLSFFRTSFTQSSSLKPLGLHSDVYPDIKVEKEITVNGTTLDNIMHNQLWDSADLLNLDIQGSEMEALIGLGSLIQNVKYIYSEVNVAELYVGAASFDDLNHFLKDHGFVLADWHVLKEGWGDALWIRSEHMPAIPALRRLARRFSGSITNTSLFPSGKFGPLIHKLKTRIRSSI
jgi:FkbM family methyltransferase